MNELIKVNYENHRQTASARDLWQVLGKPYTRFDLWFDKHKDYGFIENDDFRAYVIKTTHANGRDYKAIDYEITVDMAKELAMLQKTQKGKEVRLYLIELEKRWNSPELMMARALKMADAKMLEYQNNIILLENKIEEQKPKVLFAEAVSATHTSILIGELAKLLKQNGIDTGQNRLFAWLRDNGYLIKRKGSDYNVPTQKSMDLGLFEIKETTITHSGGYTSISKTSKVTGKGQQYFLYKFLSQNTRVS